MNKLTKRILSILLTLVLLLSNAGFAGANDEDIAVDAGIVDEEAHIHDHSDEEAVPAPVTEKKEEAAPAPAEEKKEEAAPAPAEEKKEEAAPAPAEEKKEEAAPAPVEEKKEEAAPAEEKKEEEPAAEEPAVEKPAAEEPVTEEPTAEEPAAEEPAAEEPAAEEPAAEEPAAEEPAAEEPAAEEPAAEEPAVEKPAAEEPVTEEPTAEEPATEEPAAEEPAAEEPAAEEPAAEEPAAEEPAAEEPAAEEPAAEEPAAEEPAAEEPAAEKPAAEEPAAEEPAAEEPAGETPAEEEPAEAPTRGIPADGEPEDQPEEEDELLDNEIAMKAAAEVCTHENWDYDEDYENTYTEINQYYHLTTEKHFTFKVCEDCGEKFDINEEVTDSWESSHSWENGVCRYCSAENTCQHDRSYITVDFDWDTAIIEKVDLSGHRGIGRATIYEYCEDCGELIDVTINENAESFDSHHWENGYCRECGAENTCQHENLKTESYFKDWNWEECEYVDAKHHKILCKLVTQERCQDCGLTMNQREEDSFVLYEHEWDSDGYCYECHAQNTCPHEHLEEKWSYWMDDPEDRDYDPLNEKYHQVTGRVQWRTYCEDCGLYIDLNIEEGHTEREQHTWNDNVCVYCQLSNECKHETLKQGYNFIDWDEVNYIEIDALHHKVIGDAYVYNYCAKCGMHLNETLVPNFEVEESHNWRDGYCVDCGATNECAHEHLNTWWYWVGDEHDLDYVPLNNTYHQVTGEIQWRAYCEDCGLYMDLNREGYTQREWHEWNDEGVCEYCGFTNECQHESVREDYNFIDWDAITWKSIDMLHHKAVGDAYVYDRCDNCGAHINETLVRNYEAVQTHYWVNGVCEECGAKNECTHEHLEDIIYWRDRNVEYIDEKTHREYGQVEYGKRCLDCDMWFPGETRDWDQIYQHNFEGGVCECGYVNTCTHEVTEDDYWPADDWNLYTYRSVSMTEHEKTGRIVYATRCLNCGEEITREVKTGTITEDHNWENGKCTLCGQENTCTHENLEYDHWSWRYDQVKFTYADELHCKAVGQRTVYDYCPDCRMRLNVRTEDNAEWMNEHWWTNGVCEYCGATNTCQHDGGTKDDSWWKTIDEVTDNQNGTHHIKGIYHYVLRCAICGQYLEESYEETERDEEHSFYDGVCWICGANQVAAPEGVKGSLASKTSSGKKTTITWSAVEDAKGYNVYLLVDGKLSKLTSEPIMALTFTYSNPSYGKKCTYYVTVITDLGESRLSEGITTIALKKTSLTVTPTSKGAKLTWTKVTGATGYKIMRGSTTIATIKSGSTVTYTDKKFKTAGKKCTYSVKPYTSGTYSTTTVKTKYIHMGSVTNVKLANSSAKKLTISWTKAKGAVSYEVYYSTSSKKPTASTKAKKTTSGASVTVSATKGKTYYVYVRAIGKNGSTKTKGAWTAVKKIKITR